MKQERISYLFGSPFPDFPDHIKPFRMNNSDVRCGPIEDAKEALEQLRKDTDRPELQIYVLRKLEDADNL